MIRNLLLGKRIVAGLEFEYFTVDSEGSIAPRAKEVIRRSKQSREVLIMKEVGKHMIELLTTPHAELDLPFKEFLEYLEHTLEATSRIGLRIYPFATYPGSFEPELNAGLWYRVKEKLLGEDKFRMAGMCAGFHFHLELPHGSFGHRERMLKQRPHSSIGASVVDNYNFLIAADPAVSTFMQSSPFMEGRLLAKDSRLLLYRGGTNLGYVGLYHKLQLFGGLQSYATTLTDLIKLIEKRYAVWKSMLLKHGFDPELIKRYGRKLDYAWNPVKINKHGTFEQRGMDTNLPSYALAASTLLQRAIERIRHEKLRVTPIHISASDAFKVEGGAILVPSRESVQKHLQYHAAISGISHPEILAYCRNFYRFAKEGFRDRDSKMSARAREVIAYKETVSDKILKAAASRGIAETLGNDEAAELALALCDWLESDIKKSKRLVS